MSDKPRINFENSSIGDGNVFGDNSSSTVQKYGRDDFKAQLMELRAAVYSEAALPATERNELLQSVDEAMQEAQKSNPAPKAIKEIIGKLAGAVTTGAFSKVVADTALVPLIHELARMANHLF